MESSWEAETIDEDERRAREELRRLVADGKAQDVLNTYYFCKHSCDYVYDTLRFIAHQADSGVDPEIVNFARNLLDDWCK